MKIEEIKGVLVKGIQDYFVHAGFTKAVVGLSGGVDSAVTAALAVEALGKKNVLGVLLPGPYSSSESVTDAGTLAAFLGIETRVIRITDLYNQYLKILSLPGNQDITEQNIQARIRCTILMAIANKERRLLLATGNKSEALVGYATLYGDLAGAIAPLGSLYKTGVYALAKHLGIPEPIIKKAPSAELHEGQKDEDILPPYYLLDKILKHLVDNTPKPDVDGTIIEEVKILMKKNAFKQKQAPPAIRLR